MNTIAVDCGASFIKGALFSGGEMQTCIRQAAPPEIKRDIFRTEKISALVGIVREMLQKLSEGLTEATLCISNEMHGFLLAYPDGRPYTGYLSWQTELLAAAEARAAIAAQLGEEQTAEAIRCSGMPLRSGLPVSNLVLLAGEHALPAGVPLHFYTLGDYLIRVVTGIEPYCHPTNAAATGFYDLLHSQWNTAYFRAAANGAEIILPPVRTDTQTVQLGGVTLHIKPAVGDQQAALLGSGLLDASALSFNMGTGAQVSRITAIPETGDFQLRPYFYGKYIKTIPHIPSGRALNVLFRFLRDVSVAIRQDVTDAEIWDMIGRAEERAAGSISPLSCDLSFFENAVTDHTSGSITGIGEFDLTLDHLVGSVFHQMADNFISVAKRLLSGDEQPPEMLLFSGGIANRWHHLRTQIADGLGLGVPVTVSEHDTLHGCRIYGESE